MTNKQEQLAAGLRSDEFRLCEALDQAVLGEALELDEGYISSQVRAAAAALRDILLGLARGPEDQRDFISEALHWARKSLNNIEEEIED